MFNLHLPIELLKIMIEHYEVTGIVPSVSLLDTMEWQLTCPLDYPLEKHYSNEVAYSVNWKPYRPLCYFATEAYAGTGTDYQPFQSVKESIAFTRKEYAELMLALS